jgi:iron complex transport system ATP-binding protein
MGERINRLVQAHKTIRGRPKTVEAKPDSVAISLIGVSYSSTRKPFIENCNLDIARGQITSIVGPNGCGKSTLLKIIDGLIVPRDGEILVGGRPCHSMSGKERARHLALLPQGARPPTMSVETLVACGRHPYQRGIRSLLGVGDKQKIEEAMAMAGVVEFRHQDVRFLSGGERQRAFIAMILAQDTDIVVMDEPTTYLDVNAGHEIMQLIAELNASSGKTIVMVNHDIDLALRYSDQMAVMAKGKLLYSGEVDDVLSSGKLEEAFKIRISRFSTNDDVAYTFFPL